MSFTGYSKKRTIRTKHTHHNGPNPDKSRADVFKDTVRYSRANFRLNKKIIEESNEQLTIGEIDGEWDDAMVEAASLYPINITVSNQDTLLGAIEVYNDLIKEISDPNIPVLNYASDYVPGGSVAKGKRAQEEELFRRTNYCTFLGPFNRDQYYPMKSDQMILTRGVKIIKNTDFTLIPKEDQISCDFLALPAIRRPKTYTVGDGLQKYADSSDLELMRQKIESIYKIGVLRGYDALVLGALGCGAFRNPVNVVRDIFKECNAKYGRCFRRIHFTVMSRNDDNFTTFKSLEMSSE